MRGLQRGWLASASSCAVLAAISASAATILPVTVFGTAALAESRVIVLPRLRGGGAVSRTDATAAASTKTPIKTPVKTSVKAAEKAAAKRTEIAARTPGVGRVTSLPRLRNDTVTITKPVEITAPERKAAERRAAEERAAKRPAADRATAGRKTGAETERKTAAADTATTSAGATGLVKALPRLRAQLASASPTRRVEGPESRSAARSGPAKKSADAAGAAKRGGKKTQTASRAAPVRPKSPLGKAPPRYKSSSSDRGALEGRNDKSRDSKTDAKKDPRTAFKDINRGVEHAALNRAVRTRMSEAWSRAKKPFRFTSLLSFSGRSAGSGESALRKFRNAVRRYKKDPKNRRLTILQLGDSHTAGDHLSGMMRELLQRRYGSAGRGMLAAGAPYGYYRPYQVHVRQSKGWRVFRSRRDGSSAPIGITGYAVRSSDADDVIVMQMKGYKSFQRIEIEFMKGPSSGDIVVKVGRATNVIRTRARRWVQDRAVIILPRSSARVEISPKGNGSVYLLSTSLYRKANGGVAYISHGISGETAKVIDYWRRSIVRWQLQWLKPDLIVLAYGTNEGFNHKLDLESYARNYRRRLRFLKWAAPSASIVVLGAPDAARLPSWCGRGAKRENFSCRGLSSSHAANYTSLIASRSKDLCYWHAPPTLSKVRDIQRRIARREGAYFYDWSRVMGGRCGMHKWAKTKPALAFADRVHMRAAGYDISAASLLRALLPDFSPKY